MKTDRFRRFCPGCGAGVPLTRVYCKPSCRTRHEWRQRQEGQQRAQHRAPLLPFGVDEADVLRVELPPAKDKHR